MDTRSAKNTIPSVPSGLERLAQLALDCGADAACLVPAGHLVIREELAQLCGPNKPCPGYGLSPGCPPHALQPAQFRLLTGRCTWVLLFKIDAAMELLLDPKQRQAIARRVHQICAKVEDAARIELGLVAHGYAAGSCKELFCSDKNACTVLAHGLRCPHAQVARPSLSGVGVDFEKLAALAGWPYAISGVFDPHSGRMQGLMAGLVLLEETGMR